MCSVFTHKCNWLYEFNKKYKFQCRPKSSAFSQSCHYSIVSNVSTQQSVMSILSSRSFQYFMIISMSVFNNCQYSVVSQVSCQIMRLKSQFLNFLRKFSGSWVSTLSTHYSGILSSLSIQTTYSASHQVSILRNFVEGTCAFVRECVKKVRLFIVET